MHFDLRIPRLTLHFRYDINLNLRIVLLSHETYFTFTSGFNGMNDKALLDLIFFFAVDFFIRLVLVAPIRFNSSPRNSIVSLIKYACLIQTRKNDGLFIFFFKKKIGSYHLFSFNRFDQKRFLLQSKRPLCIWWESYLCTRGWLSSRMRSEEFPISRSNNHIQMGPLITFHYVITFVVWRTF